MAARRLARELGFSYLNTGAMYRAVAIAARAAGVGPDDANVQARLAPVLAAIKIRFDGEKIMLNDRDVSASVGEPEIGDLASRFSTLGAVRARMRELQRAAGAGGGVVMEGRDIGTAIFPDAEFKFFLDADVKMRAARRFAELAAKGRDDCRARSARATDRTRPARPRARAGAAQARGRRDGDRFNRTCRSTRWSRR